MLKIFESSVELRQHLMQAKSDNKTIGFIPTMGALHEGHTSLIERSVKDNDLTVSSIFVNPTQFNDLNDYSHYPRHMEEDVKLLEASHCDILFCPNEKEMYPNGYELLNDFDPGFPGSILEAKSRPGHFTGMATIVKKFFDIIQPHKAYFGQKDYQQFLIIQKLINDYEMAIDLVLCPIVRDKDGLALSSRNRRISAEHSAYAPKLYEALKYVAKHRNSKPVKEILQAAVKLKLENTPFKLEYFEICSAKTLVPVQNWNENQELIVCIAAKLGDIRLIDNIILN